MYVNVYLELQSDRHCSIENHHFSRTILHYVYMYLCIFNRNSKRPKGDTNVVVRGTDDGDRGAMTNLEAAWERERGNRPFERTRAAAHVDSADKRDSVRDHKHRYCRVLADGQAPIECDRSRRTSDPQL